MEGKLTYGPYATVTFIVHLLRFKNTLHLFVSTQTLQYIVLEQKLQYTFSALLVSSVHFFAIKFKTSANKRVFCAQHHQRNAVHSRAEQSSGVCTLHSEWWARIHYIQWLYKFTRLSLSVLQNNSFSFCSIACG